MVRSLTTIPYALYQLAFVGVTIALSNQHRKKVWRKEFISLMVLYSKYSSKIIRAGPHTEQELCGWGLLTGMVSKDPLDYFFLEPRTNIPGTATPKMGWAIFHESLIEKSFCRLADNQILGRHSLNYSSLLTNDQLMLRRHKTFTNIMHNLNT